MDMEFVLVVVMAMMLATAAMATGRLPSGLLRFARTPRRPVAVPFPQPLDPAAHWQKATSIVELSLNRAASMSASQQAAARQLEAADYALHLLLEELNQVMNVGIASPLASRNASAPKPASGVSATALAA